MNINEKWQALEAEVTRRGGDGPEFVKAMKDHNAIYTDKLYLWLASLYDKEIGGFYYSITGRDNEPFRPDIESTYQAVGLMLGSGLLARSEDLPLPMREQIIKFCQSLISPEDGYIYHPQWDYSDPEWRHKDSRLGRDLNWANQLSNWFNFKYPYPTAYERLKASAEGGEKKNVGESAPHLASAKALIEYLDSYDWDEDAYFSGNNVVSQVNQIISAGLGDVMIDFLNKKQNPETGLWGSKGGYIGINALLKISSAYRAAKAEFPSAEKAMQAAIDCITSDEYCGTICFQYNALFSVSNLLGILKNLGTKQSLESADKAQTLLLKNAPAVIRATTEKVKLFARDDGGFSYQQNRSAAFSQGAPVAIPMTLEGDVNASAIASTGTTRNLYEAFGLVDFKVPFYDEEDSKKLLNAIKY